MHAKQYIKTLRTRSVHRVQVINEALVVRIHSTTSLMSSDRSNAIAALNTLANHGYLPRKYVYFISPAIQGTQRFYELTPLRSGVATFSQVINAAREGFNMEYELAAALTAFGMVSTLVHSSSLPHSSLSIAHVMLI